MALRQSSAISTTQLDQVGLTLYERKALMALMLCGCSGQPDA
jgi:hypothetical protein